MTVLITERHADGTMRTCNARCYNAKHKSCTCICTGINHGVGRQKAAEQTREMAHQILKEHATINDNAINQILSQTNLFDKFRIGGI